MMVLIAGYSLVVSRESLTDSVGKSTMLLAGNTLELMNLEIYNIVEETSRFYDTDSMIRESIVDSNNEFDNMENADEYLATKDNEWISSSDDNVFINEILNNDLSKKLSNRFIEYWEDKYGYRTYEEVFVTNKYGGIVASTQKTSDFAQADEEWWQQAKNNGLYISDIEYDESVGKNAVSIASSISSENEEFIGTIKAVISLRGIVKQAEVLTKEYETTETKLITANGKMIYSSKPFTVFEDISYKDYYKRIKDNGGFFIAEEGGREKLFSYSQSESYRGLRNLNWIIIVTYDSEEVLRPVETLGFNLSVISAIIVLAVVFLSFFISGSISKPIAKMRDMANEISKGNLNMKIDIKSEDEIGDLAISFNQMTADLEKSRNGLIEAKNSLELKVVERTKELDEKVIKLEQSEKEIEQKNIVLQLKNEELTTINEELRNTQNELEKTKEKIEKQNKKLKKLDQLKSAFLNITSHELRTPMSSIKGYVQMMLKQVLGEIDKEQKSALEIVLRNTNRLDHLIQDILDVSRLESGTMKFIAEKTDVQNMMSEVAETMKSSAELKDIKINIETDDSLPMIVIDRDRIKQVVINFMNNAIKFSPDGAIINICAKKDKDDIVFEVQDYGRGIPKNKQEKVFETFYQVDSGMDRKFGGAGLGLAISRGIVISHGGRIWVESTPGKGSNFKFTLPIESVKDIEKRFREIDIFGLQLNGKDMKNSGN